MSHVKVLKEAPDPYSLPLHGISDLMRFTPDLGEIHRVRVRGTVTLSEPGRLIIQDSKQGTVVEIAQPAQVKVGETLLLSSGGALFEAVLNRSGKNGQGTLREGDFLQLIGICSVQVDENRLPKSFRVLLRSPQDIVVRQSASCWSVSHTLYVLFGILLGTSRSLRGLSCSGRGWLNKRR